MPSSRRAQTRPTRAERRHLVALFGLGAPVPDGDGGFTHDRVALTPPTWYCSLRPASVRDLERLAAGTVITTAAFLLEGDYHPGITTQTQILFESRLFYVNGVLDPEARHIDTIVVATEVVDQGAAATLEPSWVQTDWVEL